MLFRQLEYFVAVAREKHFARAAEACYVSQPALSASIAKLERELNVTLINRGHNYQGLTPEGERLVLWAKRILCEQEAFKDAVASVQSGITGTLRLGTEPTASTTLALPVAAYCSAHPGARVEVDTRVSTTELRRQLLEFELDVAIAHFAHEDRAGLHVVPLYEEKYVVLASADRLPPGTDVMTWADAAQLPLRLIDPRYENSPGNRQRVRAERRHSTPAGRNGFGRFPLRTCGRGGMGEHRAAYVAACDAGDGYHPTGPLGGTGCQGTDFGGDPLRHPWFGHRSGVHDSRKGLVPNDFFAQPLRTPQVVS